MIDLEIILMGVAVICFIAMIKAVMDMKSILGSMRVRTSRMIRICDNMIDICNEAGKTRKRLIATKWGRK